MIVDPVALIRQTYREVLPAKFDTPAANVMLVAIGLQESRFVYRTQLGGGPARGFWQFERSGGVRGVLLHYSTEHYAEAACLIRHVKVQADAIHERLATDDVLACAFARLLLWTDRRAVPTDAATCWRYYLDIWRPGKPHPHTWGTFYALAEKLVRLPDSHQPVAEGSRGAVG